MLARLFAVASFAVVAFAAPAEAVFIDRFQKFTNDGVFTLTDHQADLLGTPDADRIGFLRLRTPGVNWSVGDTFDQSSILAATRNDDRILGVLNGLGTDDQIDYAGEAFDPLGLSTFETDGDVFRAVALLFSSESGDIVFTGRGTSTFNGGQATAAFTGLPSGPDPFGPGVGGTAVPLPAAAWLLLAGVGGLGLMRRRRVATA